MRVDGVPMSRHRRWAEFRFSVIGGLLSSPPAKGELHERIEELVAKVWVHPITGKPHRVEFSTIEGWYYQARRARDNPVEVLRSRVRADAGSFRRISQPVAELIAKQYAEHSFWDRQLHTDNLRVEIENKANLGDPPSYGTVVRYMKAHGMFRTKRPRNPDRAGAAEAAVRQSRQEIRSWEMEYVNAMWHFDGHHGSIKVLTESGERVTPLAISFLDDCSRRVVHLQWYLGETGENVVHCFNQGTLKCGLPRSVYADNGKAEVCEEFRRGILVLGVGESHTRNYSPYMNGKEENFWDRLENRLVAMLVGFKDLTLKQLNDFTQAWLEMEYNREIHGETGETPNARFVRIKDVGRPAPSADALRRAFCIEVGRKQRRSDGTILLEGLRYEIPSRFRVLEKLHVTYARWDLSFVHIVDQRTGAPLCRIYPIDKQANADGRRRVIEDPTIVSPVVEASCLPALLVKLVADYNACGLPPAYLPKDDTAKNKKDDSNDIE